jgi:hypothetical protein
MCQDSFFAGGNTSCRLGELFESLSLHVSWPRLLEGLMREETMTICVDRIHLSRPIWAAWIVRVVARCEQAAAVTTSDCHRDRESRQMTPRA